MSMAAVQLYGAEYTLEDGRWRGPEQLIVSFLAAMLPIWDREVFYAPDRDHAVAAVAAKAIGGTLTSRPDVIDWPKEIDGSVICY